MLSIQGELRGAEKAKLGSPEDTQKWDFNSGPGYVITEHSIPFLECPQQ